MREYATRRSVLCKSPYGARDPDQPARGRPPQVALGDEYPHRFMPGLRSHHFRLKEDPSALHYRAPNHTMRCSLALSGPGSLSGRRSATAP